jgi:hypothetical protein
MALVLIDNPPSVLAVDTDWTTFLTRENASNLGTGLSIPIFTLTNWDSSTTIPAIAEGSIIEVGGSLYQADADTALVDDAGIANGTVHIKLVPAGGGATLTPTLTNDAIPAWDANKAGWYDSDDKFLPYEMTKTSAVYTDKSEYMNQNKTISNSPDKGILTDSISYKTEGSHISFNGSIKPKYYYKNTSGTDTNGTIATALFTLVPTVGDYMPCFDGWYSFADSVIYKITSIYRESSTEVKISRISESGVSGSVTLLSSGVSIGSKIIFMGNLDVENVVV